MGEWVEEFHGATTAVDHAPPEIRRRRQASATPLERGYLALTAALYPQGNVVCAEILEFDVASRGSSCSRSRSRSRRRSEPPEDYPIRNREMTGWRAREVGPSEYVTSAQLVGTRA